MGTQLKGNALAFGDGLRTGVGTVVGVAMLPWCRGLHRSYTGLVPRPGPGLGTS